jgi:hypothetical protein
MDQEGYASAYNWRRILHIQFSIYKYARDETCYLQLVYRSIEENITQTDINHDLGEDMEQLMSYRCNMFKEVKANIKKHNLNKNDNMTQNNELRIF